jgi:hypothetical protein
MVTVYDVFEQISRENQLPPPTSNDLTHAGKMIAAHFRRFWGVMQRPEIIQKAGFVFSKEPGRTVLVIGYPDEFKGEMVKRIMMYLSQKEEKRKEIAEKPTQSIEKQTSDHKKERRRKPAQPPAFSGKQLINKK